MTGKACGFRPPIASWPANRSPSTFTESFWGSMWFPGYVGHILMENTSFGSFSTTPHRQDHSATVGGILNHGGLAAIFTELDFAGLLYFQVFFRRKSRLCFIPIWMPYVHPSLWNRTGRTVALSVATIKLSLRKMKFISNRWLANSLTHTDQYFSGLT